jgi:nucleotide-binding universal stress UspA family protein
MLIVFALRKSAINAEGRLSYTKRNQCLDLREQAYTALQAFLPTQIAHHAVELRVLVGHPFERILETAGDEQVSLIVLGTHGRTGLAHTIMGSVAERVVRLAPCPVLTVHASTESMR